MRAGVPSDWQVGDKTGMGAHGSTNDVAILWPPGHAPVLVAATVEDGVLVLDAPGRPPHRDGRVPGRYLDLP